MVSSPIPFPAPKLLDTIISVRHSYVIFTTIHEHERDRSREMLLYIIIYLADVKTLFCIARRKEEAKIKRAFSRLISDNKRFSFRRRKHEVLLFLHSLNINTCKNRDIAPFQPRRASVNIITVCIARMRADSLSASFLFIITLVRDARYVFRRENAPTKRSFSPQRSRAPQFSTCAPRYTCARACARTSLLQVYRHDILT